MNTDYNGFTRLFIRDKNKLSKELSGKTVKDVVLTYEPYTEQHNYLVITFTDNTFISIGILHGEYDDNEY